LEEFPDQSSDTQGEEDEAETVEASLRPGESEEEAYEEEEAVLQQSCNRAATELQQHTESEEEAYEEQEARVLRVNAGESKSKSTKGHLMFLKLADSESCTSEWPSESSTVCEEEEDDRHRRGGATLGGGGGGVEDKEGGQPSQSKRGMPGLAWQAGVPERDPPRVPELALPPFLTASQGKKAGGGGGGGGGGRGAGGQALGGVGVSRFGGGESGGEGMEGPEELESPPQQAQFITQFITQLTT
jgi:hypothetical protein